jgi:hypothetical protein
MSRATSVVKTLERLTKLAGGRHKFTVKALFLRDSGQEYTTVAFEYTRENQQFLIYERPSEDAEFGVHARLDRSGKVIFYSELEPIPRPGRRTLFTKDRFVFQSEPASSHEKAAFDRIERIVQLTDKIGVKQNGKAFV